MTADEKTAAESNGRQQSGVSAPVISLPKGGGAIRGMGEKFAANPVTGTGSMSVPIATSPGRSGFGPQLSLSYDSGAGNGPFGFGWNLSLPAITRKTDKGLPKYEDLNESDVFILSSAEDLVPVYRQDPDGSWVKDHAELKYQRDSDGWVRNQEGELVIHEDKRDGFTVRRYRPRIEGLFARIERWTNLETREIHWRSISKDNITTLYGKNNKSRIFDPAKLDKDDPGDLDKAHPTRIFSWLICESYDDKGNAIVYEYQAEDSQRIFEDQHGQPVALAHERNRSDVTRSANRYLKRIKYGNRTPNRDLNTWQPTDPTQLPADTWMFEVVFDYGEGLYTEAPPDAEGSVFAKAQTDPPAGSYWSVRLDPFSTYRAGFEVRTYRLCQRVLMFHHIPNVPADLANNVAASTGYDGLVRSTDFDYSSLENPQDVPNPIYSFLFSVTQSGYNRQPGDYLKKSLPPVEFTYSEVEIEEEVHEVDPTSLENLPIGLDGSAYQWTDLHGEGIPGILTEQAGAWFYKRNLSPINPVGQSGSSRIEAYFAPIELVATKPNLELAGGQAQFMDLAGDGQPDVVVMDGPMPGLYEHDEEESWEPFRPFTSRLSREMRDPNLKFVDLDGDGHADVLITEDDAFVWHPSLAEEGFGAARRVAQSFDEEKGPRVVFDDGEQTIYLADLSGDGLSDLVRIRNCEVCYWPNYGYGRFGAKVTMDRAPCFDNPDQFDPNRIRLADIDGSGTTDIIYLHRDGVRLYFNQSGNSWSQPRPLNVFPRVDDLVSIVPTDLLGNGTACLVWSSPLATDMRQPMRYVDLMGGQKPHLLVKTINNLGAETDVDYAPSTKFYLQDKRDGKPWITRLPFPVHVVEKVTTYDYISRNRFVSRYAYHHGYFDGEEREFRGFGMVEQTDTEELAALTQSGELPVENVDAASYVPPGRTKTWFHTGVYDEIEEVSQHFAADYYGAPDESDPDYRVKFDAFFETLLPDTILPDDLTADEEREACRVLKGSMLRQEVYALDGTDKQQHPYTVTEQNFTIHTVQQRGDNRHAVFFTHAREALSYHYERNPADPRIQHALSLEVDVYGNVLKSAAIGYGRLQPDASLPTETDRDKQTLTLITYTEDLFASPIESTDTYRTPLSSEIITFELTGYTPTGSAGRYQASDFVELDPADPSRLRLKFNGPEVAYQDTAAGSNRRRPIEHVRTLYRPNDCGNATNNPMALLPLGTMESLGLPGESYKLAFTPALANQIYIDQNTNLLKPTPADLADMLLDEGGYVHTEGDTNWWIPSGRIYYHIDPNAIAVTELREARAHFFLPRRFRNAFDCDAVVDYDDHDLLLYETRDALVNQVTAGERQLTLPDGTMLPEKRCFDYRVLQPARVMDPNRNRSEAAFDALGMVVGTAMMGKPEETPTPGDQLTTTFRTHLTDLTQAEIDQFVANPKGPIATILLDDATTRVVYDLDRFLRTQDANPADPTKWMPAYTATLARETHASDPLPPQGLQIQVSFSYSDGFGREIQKKIQAEPGEVEVEDDAGNISTVDTTPNIRWVGSGWTIFNNKGKPVRQYEPFFSVDHQFQFGKKVGVSPILFYDPAERVVATLHPNHSWEKVVFDPWQQSTYDVNDTVLNADGTTDPKSDEDIKTYFSRLPDTDYLPTWYEQRIALAANDADHIAADKAAVHRQTPSIAHFDTLGRNFLTIAQNRFERNGVISEESYVTRVELDIEGNQRCVRDANKKFHDALGNEFVDELGHVVMLYDYDMLGTRIHQASMEAGERWMLNDAMGKSTRAWDSRGHMFERRYDALRRLVETYVSGGDDIPAGESPLAEKTIYGESQGTSRNHRGKVYQNYDGAGVVTNVEYDFKGNLKQTSRKLVSEYKKQINWNQPPADEETFTATTEFDALNRPVVLTTPHTATIVPNEIRPLYNEANLLNEVRVKVRGSTETAYVRNIDYNAKGQRTLVTYGNGAKTTYEYDPFTSRLTTLTTTRPVGFNGDSSTLFIDPAILQDFYYTYDPAGNITRIADTSLARLSKSGPADNAPSDYTYDAIYRLIEATGREHIGQTARFFNPPDGNLRDYPFTGLADLIAHPNDLQAVQLYTELYEYDVVGNFQTMRHVANVNGWTRTYEYNATSLTESSKQSNRLTKTMLGNGAAFPETYSYVDAQGNDVHGCMTSINSMKMVWDFKDQLQQVELGGGGKAYYVYDANGQRTRKVIETQSGRRNQERIYLAGFEIYRKYEADGNTVKLERETLHIMDDKQRIAMVETKTIDAALSPPITDSQSRIKSPVSFMRYQISNHLGSAGLELNHQAQLISYEEYSPYGNSTYQARSQTETPKRYRFTGNERDEESGLEYLGARYYAMWLGRWTSCDPAGILDGPVLYSYCHANPVRCVDRTGHGAWDTIGGYFVGLTDYLVGPTDLFGRREDFKKSYNAIYTGPKGQLAKNIASNPAYANIAAATLGLMSGLAAPGGAPDGSDLPESMQETYRMFSFASTAATAFIRGVKGLRSIPPPAGPSQLAPGGVSTGGAALALAGPAVQQIPAGSLLNVTMAAGQKGGGGKTKGGDSAPDEKPKVGYEPGDRHPQTGKEVLGKLEEPDRTSATINPGNPKLDEQIRAAKPSSDLDPPPTVTLENSEAHDPASPKNKRDKSVMPSAQKQVELFNKSVATSPNGQTIPARGAMDEAGNIHQFHASGENNYHWAGQEGGVTKLGQPVPFSAATAAYFKAIFWFLKNVPRI